MPHERQPDMKDPADKELHSTEGVTPYPATSDSKIARQPQDDATPTGEDFERGEEKDGQYVGGVDRMRNTLKDEGVKDAWSDGKTQGSPPDKR